MRKSVDHGETIKLKTFPAMIFDLDGTLIDSLDDIADAANETLLQYGLPGHNRDAYRMFVGNGARVLIQRALPPWATDPPLDEIAQVFRDRYRMHLNCKTIRYDGIIEVLQLLGEMGTKLAVLSNKPDELTKVCIDLYFPEISFAAVYGDRQGIPRKPDPQSALAISKKLCIAAERCAFIGDSAVDMATGKRAGMFCIGVSWGFRERSELLRSGADVIIDHPRELLRYAIHSS